MWSIANWRENAKFKPRGAWVQKQASSAKGLHLPSAELNGVPTLIRIKELP